MLNAVSFYVLASIGRGHIVFWSVRLAATSENITDGVHEMK